MTIYAKNQEKLLTLKSKSITPVPNRDQQSITLLLKLVSQVLDSGTASIFKTLTISIHFRDNIAIPKKD